MLREGEKGLRNRFRDEFFLAYIFIYLIEKSWRDRQTANKCWKPDGGGAAIAAAMEVDRSQQQRYNNWTRDKAAISA